MIYLADLADYLDQVLASDRFANDPGGIYHFSKRPVHRLGLALEPWPQLGDWLRHHQIDALFLHRPWQLPEQLPGDVGVVAYHLAFDQGLTLGFNPRLGAALEMSELEGLGEKAGRPIGMIGTVSAQDFQPYCVLADHIFKGLEAWQSGIHSKISQIAVVGAMTDSLVREAADRGAGIYLTGTFRKPAQAAVQETGIAVITVGHRRSEEWGLRALATLLRERWPQLKILLP